MMIRTCAQLLLLLLICFTCSVDSFASSRGYVTEFVCEGGVLNITCASGQLIRFVRANYGRFSVHICSGGDTERWSVQCLAPRTLRTLQHGCGVTNHCSLPVTSKRFGDFCANTPKYLEVHYHCVPEVSVSSTTRRPSPPWQSPSQYRPRPHLPETSPQPSSQNITSTSESWLQEPTASTEPHQNDLPPRHLPLFAENPHHQVISEFLAPIEHTSAVMDTTELTTSNSESPLTTAFTQSALSVGDKFMEHYPAESGEIFVQAPALPQSMNESRQASEESGGVCATSESRGLVWRSAAGGQWLRRACPQPSVGWALRMCQAPDAQWLPADLSRCRSRHLVHLQRRLLQGDDAVTVASLLPALLTDSNDSVYHGGDVSLLLGIINQLCLQLSQQLVVTAASAEARAAAVSRVATAVWRALAWLLDSERRRSVWSELAAVSSAYPASQMLSELLIVHEQVAFLVADLVPYDRQQLPIALPSGSSLHVSFMKLDTGDQNTRFIQLPTDVADERASSVRISRSALAAHDHNNSSAAQVLVLSVLPSVGGLLRLAATQWPPVLSDVVALSIGVGRRVSLHEPVTVRLRHRDPLVGTVPPAELACAAWDSSEWRWSTSGCRRLARHNASQAAAGFTLCECDSLTSYAVVHQPQAQQRPLVAFGDNVASGVSASCGGPGASVPTHMWSYLGGGAAVLLLLPVLGCASRLSRQRRRTRRHLALCLTLGHVGSMAGVAVVAAGGGSVSSSGRLVCALVAASLQLSQLSAVLWQLSEAVQLYLTVTTAVALTGRRHLCYWLPSYGLPLLIVALCGAFNHQGYGTQSNCWLSTENYFLFSFVTPASIAISSSFCLHAISYYIWYQNQDSASMTVTSASHKQSHLVSVDRWLRESVLLLMISSATWGQFLVLQERPTATLQLTYVLCALCVSLFVLLQQRCLPSLWLGQCGGGRQKRSLHSPSASCRTLNTVVNAAASTRMSRRSVRGATLSCSAEPAPLPQPAAGSAETSVYTGTHTDSIDKASVAARGAVCAEAQVGCVSLYGVGSDKERYVGAAVPDPVTDPVTGLSAGEHSRYVNSAPMAGFCCTAAPSGGDAANYSSADYVSACYLTAVRTVGGAGSRPTSFYSSICGAGVAGVASAPAQVPLCGTRVYSTRRPCRQPAIYEEMRRVWHTPDTLPTTVGTHGYRHTARASHC